MASLNETFDENNLDLPPLISAIATDIVIYTFLIGTSTGVSLFGVAANTINTIVFSKQGVRNSITVLFLYLSVSDLVFSSSVIISSSLDLVSHIRPDLPAVDPLSLTYVISPAKEKIYAMSTLTTMLLSLERCFCVVFPFHVKSIFTKSRSVKAVMATTVFCAVCVIPEYLTGGLEMRYDDKYNLTRLSLWLSLDRGKLVDLPLDTLMTGIVPVSAGITTTICSIYMTVALKKSNKFRQSKRAAAQSGRIFNKEVNRKRNGAIINVSKNIVSRKDMNLVKTVTVVNVIFLICNIPRCMIIASTIVANYYIPQFSLFTPSRYRNVVIVINTLGYAGEAVNSALNFVVYYIFSQNFRATFRQIFCMNKDTLKSHLHSLAHS